jgi:hypothetical protein
MRLALAVLLVPCLAAAAAAKDLKVPSADYPTIQFAADAAQPGDRIVVAKGVYVENVTMSVANVSFLGKKAVWDGGSNGTCLLVNGGGLVVKGFAFRNGSVHLSVGGLGTVVRKCIFTGAGDYAVASSGDGLSVSACRFRGNAAGIDAAGVSCAVSACRFQQTDSAAVAVVGNAVHVEKCVFVNTDGGRPVELSGDSCVVARNAILGTTGDALRVSGNGAHVEANSLTVVDNAGIAVSGNDATVARNRVTACRGLSIEVIGDGAVVDGNRLLWGLDNGITVTGDAFLVTGNSVVQLANNSYGFDLETVTPAAVGTCDGNTASDTAYWGFYVNGDNLVVSGNEALRCGAARDGGFWIQGDDCVITGNLAEECAGDGFLIEGSANGIVSCRATDCTIDGFDVSGDFIQVEGCTASNCGGEGLDNGGVGTDALGNTFLGNRIDIANRVGAGATFDQFTGNVFVSGGITTEPEID